MNVPKTTKSVISIPAHVLSESLDGETVLLNISSGMYFGLTPVASRFWELVRQGASRSEAHLRLLEEFDVETKALQEDLDELLITLEARELITWQAA